MITFNKINQLYAEVLYNDVKVGNIEKYTNIYTVEVKYLRMEFKHTDKHLIPRYIHKLYFRLQKEELKRGVKMKKSILQTGFKIKE